MEINIPNSSEYLPLGYDSKTARFTSNTKKHYRYYVDKELEKTPFLPETPFDEFIITRGKRINKTTLLSNNNMDLGIKEVGKFKGWIDVESEAERAYKKNHELDTKKLDKQFMEKTHCFVRVYVLSAISLTQMDTDSLSDPYLKLSLGDIVLNNEKEYQTDKTDCDFYKFFEFKTIFPGACVLKVQVWDRDPLTADDLIGN